MYFSPNFANSLFFFFLYLSVTWYFQSCFFSSYLIFFLISPLPSLPSPSLPASHILSMNAGRIKPAGITCLPALMGAPKRAAVIKGNCIGLCQESLRNTERKRPSPSSRPPGPTTGSYLEKPREKSGETRKIPSLPGTPSRDFSSEPKFSGPLPERLRLTNVSGHKL